MFWNFSPISALTKPGVSQGSSDLVGLLFCKDGARRQLDVAFTALLGCAPLAGSPGILLAPTASRLPGAEKGSREHGHLYLGAISPEAFN